MNVETHTFSVKGMSCGGCSARIDNMLTKLPGVSAASTDLDPGRTTVDLDSTRTTAQDVLDAITELGFTARVY